MQKLCLDVNLVAKGLDFIFQKGKTLSELSQFVYKLFFNGVPNGIEKYLFLIGILKLTYSSIKFSIFLSRIISTAIKHKASRRQLNQKNLKQKYGDCWVLVTGFTDGIGWSFAKEFAKMNFNQILISRTQQKIEKRVGELSVINPKINILPFRADLGKQQQLESLSKQLLATLNKDKIDLGIIVNNAGVANIEPLLKDVKPKQWETSLTLNVNTPLTFSKMLLPGLLERKEKSAIINISSISAVFLCSGIGTYPAGKRILDVFSRTLRKQNDHKVDVISSTPAGVATKMLNMAKGPFIISPEDCVRSTLADTLTDKTTTFGGLKHKISAHICENQSQTANFIYFEKAFAKIDKLGQ